MLAYPPAGAFVGAPKWGVFPVGKFHGDPVGRWLDMLNGRAVADGWLEYRSSWAVVPVGQGVGNGC